jgi:signal transduction histidine kinase
MTNPASDGSSPSSETRRLTTLERLLAISATDVRMALNHASQLLNDTLRADKSEVFLYDPTCDTLISSGISDTPMARKQIALGLDRLPVSNGGKTVQVFQTGASFRSGHLDQEPDELPGIKHALGVRSVLVVSLDVNGVRRGAIQIDAAQPEHFTAADVPFLEAVSHWVGLVLQRTELGERIAQAAAEQARHRAADDLITILAHDLRAPLTALNGRAFMLAIRAEREGHQASLHDAQGIRQAVDRLERMIADLLDTARLEQGLFTLMPTVMNLADVVRETVATLMTGADEIAVRTPDEVVVAADPERIRQVLENLLSNARKHAPVGVPVRVEVQTESRTGGAWAVVAVRDEGPGIAPEMVSHLFKRFVAGRGTTGLGLGLYLAHGIAAAHGGTLTVESQLGNGATFRLALPLPNAPG